MRIRETRGVMIREEAFYLSSLEATPERFGEIIREHWGVENGLHWVLDAQMRQAEQPLRVTSHGT